MICGDICYAPEKEAEFFLHSARAVSESIGRFGTKRGEQESSPAGRCILFVGTFERRLDSSHRFRLPKEILREFAPDVVDRLPCLSISGECLLAFPPGSFQEVVERFTTIEISDPQQRQLARELFANTENCKVDGTGRMMLPIHSRTCAGIRSSVVLVGGGKYFEIWAKERYCTRRKQETGTSLGDRLRRNGLTI